MIKLIAYEALVLLILIIAITYMFIMNHRKSLRLLNLRLRVIYSISKSFQKFKSLKDISDYTVKLLIDTLEDISCGGVLICKDDSCNYNKFYDILHGYQDVSFSKSFVERITEMRHYFSLSNEERLLNSYVIHKGETSYKYLHIIKFYLEDDSYGAFILGSNKDKIDDLEYEFLRIVCDHFAFGVKSKHLSTKLVHFTRTIDVLENTYQTIVDNLPIGIVGVDNRDDYKIILWNELMENMFNMKSEDIYSKPISALFKNNSEKKIIDRLITRTSVTKEVQELPSFSVDTSAGKKYFLVLCYLVEDSAADFQGTVLVFKDITETMSLEKELQNAQDLRETDLRIKVSSATKELQDANVELRKLNNLKSEFVSIVSHELRTPLTSIRGYASLLLSNRLGDLNEQQKLGVNVINDEGVRLSNLINDLLDLSRLESGKTSLSIEKKNIVKTIETAFETLEIQANKKNITLGRSGMRSLTLFYDPEKIKQVFYNLIGNAIKFTPDGGSVTVELEKSKDFGIIKIIDTGLGISKKDLKKIFEPFLQVETHLNRNTSGTGLGLTISKHIIELHHGRIEVDSKVNKGSEFRVYIPRKLDLLESTEKEMTPSLILEETVSEKKKPTKKRTVKKLKKK